MELLSESHRESQSPIREKFPEVLDLAEKRELKTGVSFFLTFPDYLRVGGVDSPAVIFV